MPGSSCRRNRIVSLLAFALVALSLALPGLAGAQTLQCSITGKEVSCGPTQLCGPEGPYTYFWAPPGGGVQTTRCINAMVGGVYSLRIFDATGNGSEPCFFKLELTRAPLCAIKGPESTCEGIPVDLCGPDGYEYSWSGPGGFTETSQCVHVSAPGTYTLTVRVAGTECTSTCTHKLEAVHCVTNCPRTVGFWGQQCAQKLNGSTKFTVPQVTQIAQCVDQHSSFFSWSSPFNNFCSVINSSRTDQRTQAKRQYAAFLANICTGELGLTANNGNKITLDLNTRVVCGGQSITVGDLITSVDQKLADLEPASLSNDVVKSAYSGIINCLDPINNGIGIGPVCPELLAFVTPSGGLEGQRGEGFGALPMAAETGDVELFKPYPNPFTGMTRMFYAVAPGGAQVRIGVYDIAGRMVKGLESGFMSAGRHEASWDGTGTDGTRVRAGMYFIRGSIGGERVGTRIMYLK